MREPPSPGLGGLGPAALDLVEGLRRLDVLLAHLLEAVTGLERALAAHRPWEAEARDGAGDWLRAYA